MGELESKSQAIEIMQLKLNVMKLEKRFLEIDEEKIRLNESIAEQNARLKEIEGNEV